MTNLFSDFRRLVVAALDDLVAAGGLPPGLDFGRVAIEPPRDPVHGDLATNAAMVLAGALKENPMPLAEWIAAALMGRELVTGDYCGSGFTGAAARPGFINVRLLRRSGTRSCARSCAAGTAYGIRRSAAASGSMSSLFPPIRPGRCMSATAAARWLATRWQRCWPRPASGRRANITSTMPAPRSTSSRARHICAIARLWARPSGRSPRGSIPANILSRPAGPSRARRSRWLGRPERNGWHRCANSPSRQMMALIRDDLAALGVSHDLSSPSASLSQRARSTTCLGELEARGLIYTGVLDPPKGKLPDDWEPRAQTLFRATQFGDDVDRPLRNPTAVDLFRRRHRLSSRQIPARFR